MNKYPTPLTAENQRRTRALRSVAAGSLMLLAVGCGTSNRSEETPPTQSQSPIVVETSTPGAQSPGDGPTSETPSSTPTTASASPTRAASASPRATVANRTPENTCPWKPGTALDANTIYTKMGGNGVAATMLDLRCADFPNEKFGMPTDGDVTTKHFYGFKKPTTKAQAIDLNVVDNLQNRGPYLSEFVGVCKVEGQVFEGSNGYKSNEWLKIIALGGAVVKDAQYVPVAEGSYVQASAVQPVNEC